MILEGSVDLVNRLLLYLTYDNFENSVDDNFEMNITLFLPFSNLSISKTKLKISKYLKKYTMFANLSTN